MNTTSYIVTEFKDHILSIRFNRLDRKNAINTDMYMALTDAFNEADTNKNIRAVFISGDENCFCAGNDLSDFAKGPRPKGVKPPGRQFLSSLRQCSKPIVAAVAGPAIGIGTTMLLHCDLIYSSSTTIFKMPFTQLGLCPEASSSYLLPALMGHQRASELLLLGKPLSPVEALEFGLINGIIEINLIETAYQTAVTLAQLPPSSIQLTKKLMKEPIIKAMDKADKNESIGFERQLGSEEAKEAMAAFFEKRPADFSRF
jgi:enoyl-CoA hydratase/carnithine racemase